LLKSVLNQILKAQATGQLQDEPYERTSDRQGYRNGTYPYRLSTRVSTPSLREPMKIAVAGIGCVGLSISVLLAQHNEVTALTTTPQKVDMLKKKISPIRDAEIEEYLRTKNLNLTVTTDRVDFYEGADYIVVATPTDYDPVENYFNTSTVEAVIGEALSINSEAVIIIKSTVPVGYTERIKEKFKTDRIIFSPEFLRCLL